MIWLLGLLALGEDNLPELWAQMHEGQLVHLVDGSPQEAIEIFSALLKGLPQEHPLFGELLFSLGRAQYDAGSIESCKKSIYSSLHVPFVPKGAQEYYLHLLAEEGGIQKIPYSGNPWVSLEEKKSPHHYAVRLYDEAQSFSTAYLDVYTSKKIMLTIITHTMQGTTHVKNYDLSMGSHRMMIRSTDLAGTKESGKIFMLEVQTKNKDSFSLSSLVLQ